MTGFTIPALAFDDTTYPVSPIEVCVDKGMTKQVNPRKLVAKFGDGYSQSVSDGLNPIEEAFNVTFNKRPRAEIDNIVRYFEVLKGVEGFNLTLNDDAEDAAAPEKTIIVKCTNWTQTWLFDNYYACSATFERTYSLGNWTAV